MLKLARESSVWTNLAPAQRSEDDQDAMRREITSGLLGAPKRLPSKYLTTFKRVLFSSILR
jgi:uncharacterized SAM-dependent methyltransferase